jgi:branched-chain amino acid transport system ATP-binding protein
MTARLELVNLQKNFGGIVATDNVSLDFAPSSLSAIIGPNGAGKTTLFNLITGRLKPTSGQVRLDGKNLVGMEPGPITRMGIGRAFQTASLFKTFTVRDSLAAAVLSRQRALGDMVGNFPGSLAGDRADHIMRMLGLERHARRGSSELSHGDQKLLDIALALALEPKVLLLDEPTAGMGREEARAMIERVHQVWEQEKITLIFIEHDMELVFGLAQSVRVLRYGAVLAEGTPAEIRVHPAVVAAYLGSEV